jgi:N-acetylmuramoyl-L-alanine amidase
MMCNTLPSVRALLFSLCLLTGGHHRLGAQEAPATEWKKQAFTGHPLEGLRVALDVGHSRLTPGAMSARGRGEFLFNLSTARVIAGVLERAGAKVILINGDGAVTGLADRAVAAGREKADCFISVHHDSVNDKYLQTWVHEGISRSYADNFRGYSVFASSKNAKADQSREMALAVGAALLDSGLKPTLHHNEPIKGENRPLLDPRTGVYEFTDLVVLKSAEMPAILLECGVIIHREEEVIVQDPEYQDLIAHAVVKALSTVFPREKKKGLRKLFGGN